MVTEKCCSKNLERGNDAVANNHASICDTPFERLGGTYKLTIIYILCPLVRASLRTAVA